MTIDAPLADPTATATSTSSGNGRMLLDLRCVAAAGASNFTDEALFDPTFWAARGQLTSASAGRGAAWFIAMRPRDWVLRHYRRGGLLASLLGDRYLWCGEIRVRAFAEWRMLERLRRDELPVPKPVAARYQRSGMAYRCDLITERIDAAQPLSATLAAAAMTRAGWSAVGVTIARLHAAGVDHADLNAHNVLIGSDGTVSIIDFDRGEFRDAGGWRNRNLARLLRSLRKVALGLPSERFSPTEWNWLLAGYAAWMSR